MHKKMNLCECIGYLYTSIYVPVQNTQHWWLSLQPPAHAGSSLTDLYTLKMEDIRSSETQDLHGATSQKTVFFIVTAVKTLNSLNFIA
jgi:hypothetical protein